MAYFDYNATTPLNEKARQALVQGMDKYWFNPSSPYRQSAQVHNVLESARATLALRLGKLAGEVIFTAGATEANNSVISYLSKRLEGGKQLAISPFEHPSVGEAAEHCFNHRIQYVRSTQEGTADLNHLMELIKNKNLGAVSVMAVNNETGIVQPWQQIAELCCRESVLFHCDASQWFGKCSNGNFENCDFVVGCGHKFGGPKGVGFLALSGKSADYCSQLGGGQEFGKRGGTENVPSILSMVAALEAAQGQQSLMDGQSALRQQFEDTLESEIPGVLCIGKSATRVPNTSFLLFPEFENLRWVTKLDVRGFQVSTGSACSTGKTSRSSALTAMGFPADAARKSIRVSSGPTASASDWEGLARAFLQVWAELKKSEDDSAGSDVISI